MQAALDEIRRLEKANALKKGEMGAIALSHGVSYPGLMYARSKDRDYRPVQPKPKKRTEKRIRLDLQSMLEEQYRNQQKRWGFP